MLASGGTPGFAAALTSLLLPAAEGAANSPGEAFPEGLVRQKIAGDGKDLPESFGETSEDGEEKDEAPDTPFAWFAIPAVAPEPAPIALKFPLPANAIQLPEGETGALPALPELAVASAPNAAEPVVLDAGTAPPAATGAKPAFELSAPAGRPILAAPPAVEAAPAGPQRIELPPAQPPAVGVQPIALAAQPRPEVQLPAALQSLAAPLAATAIEAPTPFRRQLRDLAASALSATTQAEAPRPTAVTATSDAQQPALDMRRQEWMGAMVEHIEALRDASPMRETNIRLAPDALGSVDISIRHEGDRVHVRFTADNATARTLLAEAQPRLNELAEARGLRLGQTSVEGGAAGQGNQRHTPAPQTAFASAPASAPGTDTASTEDRIA